MPAQNSGGLYKTCYEQGWAGFVEAVPSRVVWDGTGTLRIESLPSIFGCLLVFEVGFRAASPQIGELRSRLLDAVGDDGMAAHLNINGNGGPQAAAMHDLAANPHVAAKRSYFQRVIHRAVARVDDHGMAGAIPVFL